MNNNMFCFLPICGSTIVNFFMILQCFIFVFQNGVIRGLLLAFRFLGKDRGGPGGVVINGGASSSSHPLISLPIFTATKHAVAALTRTYGDQYHFNLTGIKVVGLCPSPAEDVVAEDPRRRLMSSEYEQAWHRDIGQVAVVKYENFSAFSSFEFNCGWF